MARVGNQREALVLTDTLGGLKANNTSITPPKVQQQELGDTFLRTTGTKQTPGVPTPKSLQAGAEQVISALKESGYEAFLAGGCVRDELLGKSPKDFDIATNARPETVANLFRNTRPLFQGVVQVVLGKDIDFEVATFRKDGVYTDGRRPKDVTFVTTPNEDVQRRDFTINGLLMDPKTHKVIDLVGGVDDLNAGVIRTIGKPSERFAEDKLRMLRAVRFAARYNFTIEDSTLAGIKAHAPSLNMVSAERIRLELEGVFASDHPDMGYRILVDTGLIDGALPHARGADHEATSIAMGRINGTGLPKDDRILLGWALTLNGLSKLDAEDAMKDSRLTREQTRGVRRLLNAAETLSNSEPNAALTSLLAGRDGGLMFGFQKALFGPNSVPGKNGASIKKALEDNPLPQRPILDGRDLSRAGIRPGAHFKKLLQALDVAVLERRITDKEAAIAFVLKLSE